jgi:transcriptional regulator with XRE-family HTH domain
MKLRVGDKLRSIREESKRSQDEMAELLEMQPSLYIRYEQNEIDMDMSMILKVGMLLNLPIEDLMADTFQIKSTNHGNGQASLVMGNYSYYGVEELPRRENQPEGTIKEPVDLQKEYEYLKETLDNIKREFEELKSLLNNKDPESFGDSLP